MEPTDLQNLGIGLVAGGIAAFISNPVEVCLVRMQADGETPTENFVNDGLSPFKCVTGEGVRGVCIWRRNKIELDVSPRFVGSCFENRKENFGRCYNYPDQLVWFSEQQNIDLS